MVFVAVAGGEFIGRRALFCLAGVARAAIASGGLGRPATVEIRRADDCGVGAAYVPLAYIYSPWTWSVWGPFSAQLCRPAHYVVYFFAGMALGSYGLDRGLLACDGPLARRWWAWWIAAIVSAGVWAGLMWLTTPDWGQANPALLLIASLSYPVACACGGLTLLAACLRFAGGVRFWVLDSLSANAYSIYLIHYMFVVWMQYALLGSDLIAPAKAAVVLATALPASWLICVGYSRLVAGSNVVAAKRAVSSLQR